MNTSASPDRSSRSSRFDRIGRLLRLSPADRLLLAAGLVAAFGFLITSPVGDVGPLRELYSGRPLLVKAIQWVAFAIAVAGVLRAGRRQPARIGLILLVAALCQLPGLTTGPRSSNDAYRYVLDGRVQLAGISPYRYAPLDDHLARLRDPLLFPGITPEEHSGVITPARIPTDPTKIAAVAHPDPRTLINRPGVPTIYPPVAQVWFTVIAFFTPWSAGTLGLQWAAALLALAMTGLIGAVLRRRGHDPGAAIYWAWSPLAVLETGNGAHVDVLAAGLILAAMIVLGRPSARARVAGGILIGLAVATKVLPMLLLPAVTVLRRRHGGGWWRGVATPISAGATVLASYVPHLLVAGSLVLGYLPGYLTEEGFSDGSKRYVLLALVVPEHLRQPVALGLLLALALWVLATAQVRRPEYGALWIYGGSLLISTPEYPWYCLPLLALAALARRPEWLALGLATQVAYIEGHSSVPMGWAYLAAGLVVLGTTWWRARASSAADRTARSQEPEQPAPVPRPVVEAAH